MVYNQFLALPNDEARARLLGKEGKKCRDIEAVSGACLVIDGLRVGICAPSKTSLDLALQLVMKSEAHRLAARKVILDRQKPVHALKSDLLLAAYYTIQK